MKEGTLFDNVLSAKRNLVLRRVNWLLEEARQPDAAYDQVISKIMRQLSNYVMFGIDLQSHGAKGLNLRVSVRAFLKLQEIGFDAWHKITTNEHQKPLKNIWNDIVLNCDSWIASDILKQFSDWPMTTVLKEEDSLLRNQGKVCYSERYIKAGIEVMILNRYPKSYVQ